MLAELRARWFRTGQNVDALNGGGDIIRNSPDGWVGAIPQLSWQGSDQLATIFTTSPGGFELRTGADGIVYTIPVAPRDPAAIPAVGRATGLICDTIASLPWRVVRGNDALPLPRWVADPQLLRPDDRILLGAGLVAPLSAVAFWTQVLISQVWAGAAFVWIPLRDVAGAPMPPLFVLNPHRVTVRQTPVDGYAAGVYLRSDDTGRDQLIPADEILVLPGAGPYADGVGQGVLTRYAGTFLGSERVDEYLRSVFTNGVPSGYLQSTSPNITPDQARDLKAKWMEANGRSNSSIAVLNASTTFTPLTFSPVDAALVDSGHFTTQQIALAFGMEPYLLGEDAGSSTYANIESRQTSFVSMTLLPWIRRLEAGLSSELPHGTSLRVDLRGLLRGDTPTRYAAYQTALTGGWMTVDEVRELEDLGPMPITITEGAQP